MKRIVFTITLLLFMIHTSWSQDAQGSFGYETVGGVKVRVNNLMIADVAFPPCEGIADSIAAYFRIHSEVECLAKCALYRCASAETLLVDSTAEQDLSLIGGNTWVNFPLLNADMVYPVDTYLITIWVSTGENKDTVLQTISGGFGKISQSVSYAAWPSDWTGGTKTANYGVSTYCFFTPTMSPPDYFFGAAREARTTNILSGNINGGHYIPPVDGRADSIRALIKASSTCSTKAAIYVCAAGDTLIRDSSEVKVLSAGTQWVTFDLLVGDTLTTDSTYVLVVWANGGYETPTAYAFHHAACREPTSATNCPRRTCITPFGSWPSDLTGGTVTNTKEQSIYLYCTNTAPGGLEGAGRSPTAEGTFGWDGAGTSKSTINNYIRAEVGVPPCQGTSDTIVAYLKVVGSTDSAKAALYRVSYPTVPETTLVDSSAKQQLTTGTAWVRFPLVVHPTINPSDTYLIAVWAKGTVNDTVFYTGAGGYAAINKSLTYTTWPSDLTGATKNSGRENSIFCIFTPSYSSPNYTFGSVRYSKTTVDVVSYARGGLFIPTYDAIADSIRVLIQVGAACSLRAAIYKCAGGDTTRRDTSSHIYSSTGFRWISFPMQIHTSLANETTYVLLINANSGSGNYYRYFPGCRSGTSAANCPRASLSPLTWATAWADDISPTINNTQEGSIFCYYHTVSPPAAVVNYLHGPGGAGVLQSAQGASKLHGP